jgi:tRNA (mo5U34)-methyltransferase
MSDSRARREEADAIDWFHSIDLGDGVVTHGASTTLVAENQFPKLEGRTVLDVGAWDGYYSFLAERAGASQVVALDNYVWGVDFGARDAYWNECFAEGRLPDQSRDLTDFWRPELPGRRGFDFAKATLGSKVEPRLADFASADLSPLGRFDVVFYLGVLYHMKEPLTCLERVRSVTNEVAVIETQAIHVQNLEHERILQFHPGGEINNDFGNWYVTSEAALHSLCRAAGFSSVKTISGPPPAPNVAAGQERARFTRRRTSHARAEQPSAPTALYRLLVHAFA